MDKRKFTLTLCVIFSILLQARVEADIVRLPDHLVTQGVDLKRCSQAELKAFRIFHVGYAALYKIKCQANNTVFDQSTKRLRFVYEREIPAHAFSDAAEEYLKINLKSKFETWGQIIRQFNQGYQNIQAGDYYDLIYHSKTGLKLYLNDAPVATLNDPEIGLAYFNIWFGKEPFSQDLKRKLTVSEN